jgi:hypothetical protein
MLRIMFGTSSKIVGLVVVNLLYCTVLIFGWIPDDMKLYQNHGQAERTRKVIAGCG